MRGGGGIERSDCYRFLDSLEDGSIDALITDPPYGTMNVAWDQSVDWDRWWRIVERKLKPSGVVICFAAGKFVFELQASKADWYRYDLVWHKSRPVGFLNANHRPLIAHEMILVFAPRWKASTYVAQRIGCAVKAQHKRRAAERRSTLYGGHGKGFAWVDNGTRHPTSVLSFASVSNSERFHVTQKPLDLVRWLVRSFTNRGDLVCDPFMGSCTTGVACAEESRRFTGCEREPAIYRRAIKRLRSIRVIQ